MPVSSLLTLLAALILQMASAPPAASQNQQSIVVLVNDEPITNFDVAQRVRFFEVTSNRQATAQDREKIIEELIEERIKLQEGRKAGVSVRDEQIDAVLEQMAKRNNMSVDQLTQALKQMGVHAATLRDRIRANFAWRDAVRRKFQHRVIVAAGDIDRALGGASGAEGQGREKTEFQLQRVHLEMPQGADQRALAARLAELEQVRSRFKSCEALAGLVRSLSGTSVRDIGRKSADDIPQPTRALLLAADNGQMTPPSLTASGIELYAVCGRRSVRVNSEQRQEVQAKLIDEEFQRLGRGYLADVRSSAYIERLDQTN